MSDHDGSVPRCGADILALGFGTTIAMWCAAYLARLPGVQAPGWLVGVVLLGCLVAGGGVAGRLGPRGWPGGVWSGLVASVLNLLVLGSLLAGPRPNQVAPSAWWWVPGSLLLGGVLGGLGGAIGARSRGPRREAPDWVAAFARVAVAATMLLLLVGGLVTSNQAGLAVVDWPNSFGYNMFLYPLSRMTGGIYYEHAHRLLGSLVGLTTVVLAILLQRVERRAWVRRLAFAAVLAVAIQGLLGGLRVTGHLTLATSPEAVAPSITLAFVHGVLAQLFFSFMVMVAVVVSRTWTGGEAPVKRPAAATDHALSATLVALLAVQLVLGALQRHLERGLLIHITFAVVVVSLAVAVAIRAQGLYPERPLLGRLGRWLAGLLALQVSLGILALVATGVRVPGAAPEPWQVVLATAHQGGGAALLAAAVMLALWLRRLTAPQE